jgi:hypothetical protein
MQYNLDVLRLKLPVRVAPAGVHSLRAKLVWLAGCSPVRHYGSVDIFLEAMTAARPGDVLMIDNQGRSAASNWSSINT